MPRIFQLSLLLSLVCSTTLAQHDALVELYGEGVHRYFNNNFTGADEILTRAIDSGSEDPRVHYYRGLARERAGYGGELDFETAARLEAEGKRVVDVSAALARVQGLLRTKIEKARREARIVVKQQQLMMEQARRLSQPPVAPPAPDTAGATPFPTESVPANDAGLEPAPAPPAQPEITETTNPFADDVPPAMPDATAPAGTEPSDPFSPAAPAGDTPDPFGQPPAGGAAPAAGDNPFGL
jgi:hypothetical protein